MKRTEFDQIIAWAEPDSRVLDLGCGDGTLLSRLIKERQATGYGLEIDAAQIQRCIESGVNVIEQDLNDGLSRFSDQSFDLVIMTQTLQAMHRPDQTLQEMLRIGKRCIVAIPNFGHYMARTQLMLSGAMPRYDHIPYEWYDTPNTHFCTVHDFRRLCSELNISVVEQLYLNVRGRRSLLTQWLPNLFSQTAVFYLSK